MNVWTCDSCDAEIADDGEFLRLVRNVIVDDEWDETAFDFCSVDCLASWAFVRSAERAR